MEHSYQHLVLTELSAVRRATQYSDAVYSLVGLHTTRLAGEARPNDLRSIHSKLVTRFSTVTMKVS